jgi:hypothetical protein
MKGWQMIDRSAQFPTAWDEWRPKWDEWLAVQLEAGTFKRCSFKFPPANFLADEILGVWSVDGRNVELSEVTFPDLEPGRHGQTRRYIGITFGTGAGTQSGGIASTFDELERALSII